MNLNKNNQPRGSIITLTDINFPQNQLNFSHSSQSSSSDTSKVTLNSKMNIQQIIPDDINNTIPNLIIEDKSNHKILNNKIIISPQGFKESPRYNSDGFVFFGTTNADTCNNKINDVILNVNNSNKTSNSENNTLFIIYFHLKKKKYYIRKTIEHSDKLNCNFLLKVTSPYKLSDKDVIIINSQIFFINILNNITNEQENNMLQITQLKSPKNEKESKPIIFKPSVNKITIGRDKRCSISFENDKSFSKIHSTIYYDSDCNNWFIIDGGEKESLNGTWCIPKHSVELNQNTEIKLLEFNSKLSITFVSKF